MAAPFANSVARLVRFWGACAMLLANTAICDVTVAPMPLLDIYSTNVDMMVTIGVHDVPHAQYPVVPLTSAAGLNITNFDILDKIDIQESLVNVNQSNWNTGPADGKIALLSCDSNDNTSFVDPSSMFSTLISGSNSSWPVAVLLYTLDDAYCSFDAGSSEYTMVWSMTNRGDAESILNFTSRFSTTAAITANDTRNTSGNNNNNNGAGSSSVAMSVLYTITGLVTCLFLAIILAGAVRAHRNPERYGPQAGYGGRPRQGRARGLARAVLETIPIVKFGDPHPVKNDPDQELESMPGDRQVESPEPVSTKPSADATGQTAHAVGASTTDAIGAAQTTANSPAAQASNAGSGQAENLGCSICTEDFNVGEDVRVLPCDHKFHPTCIDPWLVNVSGTCPLCRLDLNPPTAETADAAGPATGVQQEPQPQESIAETQSTNDADTLQGRRRSRLLDWNRLRHATVDERIQALREMRASGASGLPEERTQHTRLTDRLREKFYIRTRTQS
ncbi:hypothetical protein BX600DRAFT_506449 [Xylariales sp. PMI_506]|nr:hypothetical protein BX600DRAFT_506449 [Xylariales sp. PMI_506]